MEEPTVVEAIQQIAGAISRAGKEIGKEGAGGWGALEGLGLMVKEAGEKISAGEESIAEAINDLAEAVREHAQATKEAAEAQGAKRSTKGSREGRGFPEF